MNLRLSGSSVKNNVIDLSIFARSLDRLKAESESWRESYSQAKPYPHIVIDDLFDSEIIERLVAEFPKAKNRDWLVWDTEHELKTTSRGIDNLSAFTQMFCLWLNSRDVISAIEPIVGVDNLVGDPLFHGAGLHEMYRDGWLEMHADYTRHFSLPLVRRFNMLIYLNQDWDESWGGELVMQDDKDQNNRAAYPPLSNRTIIFPTTSKTLHGVPNALSCPVNRSRQLLSIYYWSPIPMPLWAKAGTPLLWASERKRSLRSWFDK
ncbi:MAG: 2OG-Fe(II) oxygenase [Cyanobacteria bacterium J06643_13]